MLNHDYSTQKNEALNASVKTYANKDITYSTTKSLDTRVAVAAGYQVLGYANFWSRIFGAFELQLDGQLLLKM